MSRFVLVAALVALTGLPGCDLLGVESADKVAAQREAEGRAIGSACRHANRALEDCYALNRKADKAAVFAGWRDMNDYMRENKMEAVEPQLAPPGRRASGRTTPDEASEAPRADTSADGDSTRPSRSADR